MAASIPPDLLQRVADITAGFKAWLAAIPDSHLRLFGVAMTGYIAGSSWEQV